MPNEATSRPRLAACGFRPPLEARLGAQWCPSGRLVVKMLFRSPTEEARVGFDSARSPRTRSDLFSSPKMAVMTRTAHWALYVGLGLCTAVACADDEGGNDPPDGTGGSVGTGGRGGSRGGSDGGNPDTGGTSGSTTTGGTSGRGGATGGAAGEPGGAAGAGGEGEATPEDVCHAFCPVMERHPLQTVFDQCAVGSGGEGGAGGAEGGGSGQGGGGGVPYDHEECFRLCLESESSVPSQCGDESLILKHCYVTPGAWVCDGNGGEDAIACLPHEQAFYQCVGGGDNVLERLCARVEFGSCPSMWSTCEEDLSGLFGYGCDTEVTIHLGCATIAPDPVFTCSEKGTPQLDPGIHCSAQHAALIECFSGL